MVTVFVKFRRIMTSLVAAAVFAVMGLSGVAQAGEFDGVKIKFAKAPHGADEIALMEEWLAPFKAATGRETGNLTE